MILRKLSIFLICLLIPFASAKAFDVDGIKSRISMEKVKEIIGTWNFEKIEERESQIVAYDYAAKPSYRYYVFNFCDGRLTYIQKSIKPSMKMFIILFDGLSKTYGHPIDSDSNRSAYQDGEESEGIDFLWRSGAEYIKLSYTVFSSNDSMNIHYGVPNRCATHPSKFKKYFYSLNDRL